MAKLLPFIFLPYLLIKKRFQAVLSFSITFAVIVILTQLILGWENSYLFNSEMGAVISLPTATSYWGASRITEISHLRGSLYTFILTFFANIDMTSSIPTITYKVKSFFIPNLLFLILAGFIFILSFFIMYKNKKGYLLYEFSIVCLVMLLVTPRTNPHYYIFTILAFISIAEVLLMRSMVIQQKVFLSMIFVLTLLLMGNIVPFSFYDKTLPLKNMAFHYFSTYSLFALATFMLWCSMIYIYTRLDSKA